MNYTRIRGTVDLYDDQILKFNKVINHLKTLSELNNYHEIKTPIFEQSELFTKAIGNQTDIVHKEFYQFFDKGNRSIALRPEGTAGVIRAIVEDKLLYKTNYPLKLFYYGPMFRYERPQSGRQRQFHQFGIEIVGNFDIYDEINLVLFADSFLTNCNLTNYTLKINNIGSVESRKQWIEALKTYFKKYENDLSEDSKARLNTNPLRILDDKIDGDKEFVKNAPKLELFLTKEEKQYFDIIKQKLDTLKVNYVVDNNLVRGLDYYTGLVFEFVSNSKKLLGQSTIIGGGKYSSLVKDTGGPDVAGIGLAIGIERIIIAIEDENPSYFEFNDGLDVCFAPLNENSQLLTIVLANTLRFNGYKVDNLFNIFDLKKHFKFAEANKSKYVCIIGEKELKDNCVLVKDQKTRIEKNIEIKNLIDFFKENLKINSEDK